MDGHIPYRKPDCIWISYSKCCIAFWTANTVTESGQADIYGGTVRRRCPRRQKGAEIVFASGRRKNDFGAGRNRRIFMVFSVCDIDLLWLLSWCGNIQPTALRGSFQDTTVRNMIDIGLVRQHKNSGSLALTKKGHQCLTVSNVPCPEDRKSVV